MMNKKAIEILKVLAMLLPSVIAVWSYWDKPFFDLISMSLWDAGLIIISIGIGLLIFDSCKDIIMTNWLKCDKFPYQGGKHICKMVERCLSVQTSYQKDRDDSLLYFCPQNIFKEFFKEIAFCLDDCAKNEIKMTLPKNPYYQLHQSRWNTFKDTAQKIDDSKVKERIKIIDLNTAELNAFVTEFKKDIKDNLTSKKIKRTKFEKYIEFHNKKKISLNWHEARDDFPIDEFIIVDGSAFISCDNEKISIDFSKKKIDDKLREFKGIANALDTERFISEIITEKIEDDTELKSQWTIVSKYLNKLK